MLPLIVFTSFGYFKNDKENASVLNNVTKMLNPKGLFVIDYLNAQKVKENYTPSDSGSFGDIQYKTKHYIKENAIYKDITFKKKIAKKLFRAGKTI